MHVGSRLRLRRTLAGMSQTRLAELLGITYQQVQKYERGANRISVSRLAAIAQALKVSPAWFFPEPAGTPAPGLAEDGPVGFVHDMPGVSVPAAPGEVLISDRATLELVRAYRSIADPLVRRRISELAKALAAVEWRADGDGAAGGDLDPPEVGT